MSLIFLLLLLSSCSFSLSSAAADDGAVLLKIKEQLGNPKTLSSWVEGFNFCNGSGNVGQNVNISCTSSGRVSGISFFGIDLVNYYSFPEAICNLTELQVLSIEFVSGMYGPIPSCINNLVHLQIFSVHKNPGFHTPIPEFLNNKNLTVIILSQSGLYGTIPPTISTSSLPKLETLDLSWNFELKGSIPWELAHHPPAYLDLGFIGLTGELPRWTNLRHISLQWNLLSGDPSSLFGKDRTVTYINLNLNRFVFDVSNVEAPENLTFLDLRYNVVYGKVPKSFAKRPGLSLDLSNTYCAGNSTGTRIPHPCLCADPSLQLPPC